MKSNVADPVSRSLQESRSEPIRTPDHRSPAERVSEKASDDRVSGIKCDSSLNNQFKREAPFWLSS